ncbi:hypothetical protein OAV85_03630, partial [Candidatus Nanopelagicales bacterium]|nr:hypothetical protein [Candidatus Nanopelagicales bacterium]
PDTISIRYLAAPVTVAAVTCGLGLSIAGVVTGRGAVVALGLMPGGVYGLGNLIASASVAAKSGDVSMMKRLPAVFATMHGAWGAGFLRGGAGS